jgi:hypothetical protein|tara:strand:- start:168 stop:392 length:225 start_codon:yes stop_codon:yes gene_type:complete
MVSVSLDLETMRVWEGLPVGDRSGRVREALKTALVVQERDLLIESLRRRIDGLKTDLGKCNLAVKNLEAFGVKE